MDKASHLSCRLQQKGLHLLPTFWEHKNSALSAAVQISWGSAELRWAVHMSDVKPFFCTSLDLAFRKLLSTQWSSTSSTWAASLLFLTELCRASSAEWHGPLARIPLVYAFRSLDGTWVNLYSQPHQDKGFKTSLQTLQGRFWCEGYRMFLLWTSSGPPLTIQCSDRSCCPSPQSCMSGSCEYCLTPLTWFSFEQKSILVLPNKPACLFLNCGISSNELQVRRVHLPRAEQLSVGLLCGIIPQLPCKSGDLLESKNGKVKRKSPSSGCAMSQLTFCSLVCCPCCKARRLGRQPQHAVFTGPRYVVLYPALSSNDNAACSLRSITNCF